MSNVQFNEEDDYANQFSSRRILGRPEVPKMVSSLMKTGLIKDGRKAYKILIIISVTCVVLSSILLIQTNGSKKIKSSISPAEEAFLLKDMNKGQ